jgi:hypothetical protein
MKLSLPTRRDVGVFRLGVVSALLSIFVCSRSTAPSRLTSALPADWKLASDQFDARVRGRFPTGTPIRVLAKELEKEGFQPAWPYDQGRPGEYAAERNAGDIACSYSAQVRWRLNEGGAVSSIRGLRTMTCL